MAFKEYREDEHIRRLYLEDTGFCATLEVATGKPPEVVVSHMDPVRQTILWSERFPARLLPLLGSMLHRLWQEYDPQDEHMEGQHECTDEDSP